MDQLSVTANNQIRVMPGRFFLLAFAFRFFLQLSASSEVFSVLRF
jgi:hypothetical protein